MSKATRADWAAQVPWSGIQDKPPFLDGPDGQIQISDVEGLSAALASKQPLGGLARVAYTGNYNDLSSLPPLGSAAYADVSNFITPNQLTVILDGYATKAQAAARAFCRC